MEAATEITTVPPLSPRPADGHKGTFGRVLVIAGSRGMAGAAVLCASAALCAGSGLVRLATVASQLPVVAAHNPCYTVAPLPEDARGRIDRGALPLLRRLALDNDAVALGPGLGQGAALAALVRRLAEELPRPLVVDADGLNALASTRFTLGSVAARVLTPHPGEMARLLGCDTRAVQGDREGVARRLARTTGAVVVLKGQATLVTDGRRLYRNTTGNPGMATGGTGDVLTGVVASLVGQGLEAFAAAQVGVFVHGVAGDLARARRGEAGMTAVDLLESLPAALEGQMAGAARDGPGDRR